MLCCHVFITQGWWKGGVISHLQLSYLSCAFLQINESTAKLGVFVSVVSTHIPFAGASKVRVLGPVLDRSVMLRCSRVAALSTVANHSTS